MTRHSAAYHALDKLRAADRKLKLPLTIFYIGKNKQHYWSAFARNGRLVAAASEGFSSKEKAQKNYKITSFEVQFFPIVG